MSKTSHSLIALQYVTMRHNLKQPIVCNIGANPLLHYEVNAAPIERFGKRLCIGG
eukprot:m.199385 g.199385  ORF g.199385 m.199385 type:complete len:55 (+) comp14940_c1_seq1:185-349(+)